MEDPNRTIPPFIHKLIYFPRDGTAYELVEPLTNFRSCHDGTPAEARMVFTCRRTAKSGSNLQQDSDEFIIKIKVQVPGPNDTTPHPGPSDTTAAEVKALTTFSEAGIVGVPHIVSFHKTVQSPEMDGETSSAYPLPGGYITYTLMTRLPGVSLYGMYWNMDEDDRFAIRTGFLKTLRSIHALGIEPVDRALRNILWQKDKQKVGIVDLELWREVDSSRGIKDETNELQRWGLVRRAPLRDWWGEWNAQTR